jgi:beta-N-acetylhexosaminidase
MRALFTEWPPMLTLGAAAILRSPGDLPERLRPNFAAVGVTLDFAPVLDVLTNPSNPVIGDRALAEDAERVAELGTAVITALQDAGIAACGKHFPGHGDTSVDSHFELPLVEHPVEQLRAREFVLFTAIAAGGGVDQTWARHARARRGRTGHAVVARGDGTAAARAGLRRPRVHR